MLSNTFAPASARRRGIVLILVLATLALMAVIGVTFATFTGQGKIGARSFAQSVLAPRPDDLMDFALQQLIADTGDVRSAIRGHSLARDMFGNDASNNGYLAGNPSSGAPFTITNFQPVANSAGLYDFQTNIPIPAADPTFYGYNFTRWILRLSYTGSAFPRPVDQTFEILYDNSQTGDMTTAFTGSGFHVFRVTPVDATTALDNPTAAAQSGLAAWQNYLVQPQAGAAQFILDGRRLRAFNGPGMGAGAIYGNFRYNGGLLSGNATFTQPGDPNAVGMDEDYDACDLENWFLAIQSADGQVIIPSFHRPAAIRVDPTNRKSHLRLGRTPERHLGERGAGELGRLGLADPPPAAPPTAMTRRPSPTSCPTRRPARSPSTSITTPTASPIPSGSTWATRPIPTRAAGSPSRSSPSWSSASTAESLSIAPAPIPPAGNRPPRVATHAAHLGNSVSELDPTYALQNANQGPAIDADPFNVEGIGMPPYTSNTQVDNAGVDVRLTQLRNLLAGTRPQPNPTTPYPALADPHGTTNGDDNFVFGAWPGTGGGQPYFMPNGIADPGDDLDQHQSSSGPTDHPGRPRALGRGPIHPRPAGLRRGRPGPELGGEPL